MIILGTNSIKDTGFNVANSCRFNDGSSDTLTRTPGSDGNKKTFTFSTWLKISTIKEHMFFTCGVYLSTSLMQFYLNSNGTLTMSQETSGGSIQSTLTTTQVFRDNSAWYHIVIAIDTTQGTDSNRVKLYVNGTQVTSFSTATYPSVNTDFACNTSGVINTIGNRSGGSFYYDGYMTETVLVDGTALDPTSFGEFDEDSGIWKPINVSGLTFGTNGFYLDFEDSAALGNDVSGNNNDFTANNLTAVDQSTDTCTNNFATLNSLDAMKTNGAVVSEGNLKSLGSTASGIGAVTGTISVSQGKWYWEAQRIDVGNYAYVGVAPAGIGNETNITGYGISGYRSNGETYDPDLSILPSWNTAGDIIMIAMDMDNGAIYFGKNGTWLNSGDPTSGGSRTGALSTFTPSSTYYAPLAGGFNSTNGVNCNFGSPPFAISSGNADGNSRGNFEYSVPSGYYALCTANLAEFG